MWWKQLLPTVTRSILTVQRPRTISASRLLLSTPSNSVAALRVSPVSQLYGFSRAPSSLLFGCCPSRDSCGWPLTLAVGRPPVLLQHRPHSSALLSSLATSSGTTPLPESLIGGGNASGPSISSSGENVMSGTPMVVESDWAQLGKHLAAFDEQREAVIKRCRDVQKLAKQAIYSLHRGDTGKAAEQLTKAESMAREMLPALAKYPALRQGSYSAAIEEYAEGMAFAVFLREGRLIRSDELPLAEPEEFLGGVLDFTGELNRYAIARATQRDKAAVQRCRDLVDVIMGRFLQFDLRNGALRKKYDGLKYTLKKMESTLYELSLTDAMGGLQVASEPPGMEQEAGGEGAEEGQ